MAVGNTTTYKIRLQDHISKALKGIGHEVKGLKSSLRDKLAPALNVAKMAFKALKVAAVALGVAFLAAMYATVRLGRSFIDAASMAEETKSKFGAVFKEVSEEAQGMADDIAGALGRNSTEVMGFMATLQDTFVPMGIARDKAMDLSAGVASLAYDLASFNPELSSAKEAIEALTSGLVGNHETFRRFGVVVSEATIDADMLAQGIEKVNGSYTQQDKIMSRLRQVLKGTADAHGDLIKTADSWFNSTEAIKSKIQELREEMGVRLIAAMQDAIQEMGGVAVILEFVRIGFHLATEIILQFLIPTLVKAMRTFKQFLEALGGVDAGMKFMAETASVLAQTFHIMWDTMKAIFISMEMALDSTVYGFKALYDAMKMLGSFIMVGFMTPFWLLFETLGWIMFALDKLVGFIRDVAIKAFQLLLDGVAEVVEGFGELLLFAGSFDLLPDGIVGAGQAALNAAHEMRDFSREQEKLKGGSAGFLGAMDEFHAEADQFVLDFEEIRRDLDKTWEGLKRGSSDWKEDTIDQDLNTLKGLFADIESGVKLVGADYDALRAKVEGALTVMDMMGDTNFVPTEMRDRVADLVAQLERLQKAAGGGGGEGGEGGVPTPEPPDPEPVKGYWESWTDGVDAAVAKLPEFGEAMENLAGGAIQAFGNGLTDALVSIADGSMKASEAFKKFAGQFLVDIGRMIIQTIVFGAIKKAMGVGFADGGVAEGGVGDAVPLAAGGLVNGGLGRLMPVRGYASGGPIVSGPHVALIGEGQHNEAVVPLPDGRSIPVDLGRGGGETNVNLTINAVDAPSIDRLLFDRRATLKALIQSALTESRSFRGAVGGA